MRVVCTELYIKYSPFFNSIIRLSHCKLIEYEKDHYLVDGSDKDITYLIEEMDTLVDRKLIERTLFEEWDMVKIMKVIN